MKIKLRAILRSDFTVGMNYSESFQMSIFMFPYLFIEAEGLRGYLDFLADLAGSIRGGHPDKFWLYVLLLSNLFAIRDEYIRNIYEEEANFISWLTLECLEMDSEMIYVKPLCEILMVFNNRGTHTSLIEIIDRKRDVLSRNKKALGTIEATILRLIEMYG
jgi:hypothetical protein